MAKKPDRAVCTVMEGEMMDADDPYDPDTDHLMWAFRIKRYAEPEDDGGTIDTRGLMVKLGGKS